MKRALTILAVALVAIVAVPAAAQACWSDETRGLTDNEAIIYAHAQVHSTYPLISGERYVVEPRQSFFWAVVRVYNTQNFLLNRYWVVQDDQRSQFGYLTCVYGSW